MWLSSVISKKRHAYTIVIIGLFSLQLSGCGSYGDSDATTHQSSDKTATNLNSLNDFFDRRQSGSAAPRLNSEEVAKAAALYQDQCLACHGPSGLGGITGISLRHCSSCSNHESLASRIAKTMPTETPSDCGKACANLLATYIGFQFPKAAASLFNFKPNIDFTLAMGDQSIIQQMDDHSTLHKAARSLASRPPTEAELNLLTTGNRTKNQNGLSTALDAIVNDQRFCSERLMEIYNDQLRTDANIETANFILLYHKSEFPNLFWFRQAGNPRLVEKFSQFTIDAIARQPLHLIAYVACNDKPFTEILTADYMVVNPYSAEALQITDIDFDNPNDPYEFKPTQLTIDNKKIPHAGILTTPSFLRRYPTTKSNVNRGRAYRIYLNFLATDILTFNGFRPNIDSGEIEHPEVNDPNCSQCHKTLDPVAQLFFNWGDGVGFGAPYLYEDDRSPINQPRPNMWPAGFENSPLPEDQKSNAMSWLAKQITQDRRFARSVVLTLNEGFTGAQPLSQPNEYGSDQYAEAAYEQQQIFFESMTDFFIKNQYNLKALAKALVMNNPYFRASSIKNIHLLPNDALDHQQIPPSVQKLGVSRLLDPDMLSRKIANTFWFTWTKEPSVFDTTFNKPPLESEISILYGKLDNESNRDRIQAPNGIMAAVQTQMATEVGLFSAMQDFSLPQAQRKLFLNIETDTTPLDVAGKPIPENIIQIQDTIRHLHQRIYGVVNEAEVSHTYDLFLDIWQQGSALILANAKHQYLPKPLKVNPLTHLPFENNFVKDEHYSIRAWGSVLSYLVNDFQFLYE